MILNEHKNGQELNETSNTSTVRIPIKIDESHRAYVNFISSLKSSITKKAYVIRLKNYLKSPEISFSTFDELLSRNVREIEQGIIDLLVEMRYKKNLSFSAQNLFLCALTHFFSINDVTINRKKIKKFMSEAENKYEYRSYTVIEIDSLLSISDEREKAIILLLASTGMRVGAVHPLRLRDLKKWIIDDQGTYVYQIQVYSSSSKYRYYTFCTPECASAIDNYLELRQRYREELKKTEFGWGPSNAYLIVRAFNRRSINHIPLPITYRSTITSNIMMPKLISLNLRPTNVHKKNSVNFEKNASENLHPCHSFRIFAITQMQRARVDKTIREMLVGHNIGLDAFYYKPSEEEILKEYEKAIDNLSISNKFRSKSFEEGGPNNDLEVKKMREKYDTDLNSIKKEMNRKFSQIFMLIQQNPQLVNIKPEILGIKI